PPCTPHLRAPSLAPTPSPSHHRRPLPFSTRLRSACRRAACGGLPAEGGEALEERHRAAPRHDTSRIAPEFPGPTTARRRGRRATRRPRTCPARRRRQRVQILPRYIHSLSSCLSVI